MERERDRRWKEKPLHGQYPIRKEGMLMAAQDQALPTRTVKVKIMKESGTSKCRMCGAREETVKHSIRECEKLAQLEYKRQDKVATIVSWELCALHRLPRSDKWYDHWAETVL